MKTWAAVLLLLILLCAPASADRIVQRDNFDDGNLTSEPSWEYVKPGPVTVSSDRATSGAYSLKIASNNELGAVRTCSGVRLASQPFTSTFNLYIESMGDEAIPWCVQNAYSGTIAAIIFILPGGTVQLFVSDSTQGFSGKSANVPYPLTYGEWHSFRITYDGSTTSLYLDGHTAPDASVSQPYVRDPSYVCIGNFVAPHTSTFYVDDLVFTRPGETDPARIYVQVCSDTSTGGISISRRYIDFPELDSTYTTPEGQAAVVMSESYRNVHRDSLGNPIKFTWYMQTGSLYDAGIDSGPLLPLDLMEDYHGDSVRRWGDEMAYHYHTWIWSDPNGDGTYYWNQAPDFSYCMEDFDYTVSRMLIDRAFYPSSFRSGWHYMDNLWQRHLDDLFPYRFENDWPAYRIDTEEPIDNVYDWRRAPSEWAPYHPDPNDYQSPGSLRGWESRSKYINGATAAILTDAFYAALDGQPQLLTLFSHLKEVDFPEQVDALHTRLCNLHDSLPMVEFEYLTGRECMLRWRNGTDVIPPTVQVESSDDGGVRTATLTFDEEIYQPQPYVARKGRDGSYSRLDCTAAGQNRWQVQFSPADTLTVAVGATDWFGNPCVQFLRMPLMLTNLRVFDVTATSAEITWQTNMPADSRVECSRVETSDVRNHLDSRCVLNHRVTLRDLAPGQVYRLVISSQDEFGQQPESEAVYFLTPVRDPFVVDNLDAGFSVVGSWSTGSVTGGAYGPDYRYASTSPTGTSAASWTWQASETDVYRVQARWSAGTNRTATARYSVLTGTDEYGAILNQQIDGGQWNLLGVSALTAGDTATVRLTNVAASGYVVIADAVRFEQAFVPVSRLGLARLLGDGESILVTGAVTGVFGSGFYVEALDRSSALRVEGVGVSVGDVVRIGGRLAVSGSERVLIGEYIHKTGEVTHLRPFGMSARNLGWLEVTGMLVQAWGTVTAAGDGYFYIDDGSELSDCTGSRGVRVDASALSAAPSAGDRLVVTGVLSVEACECGPVSVIRPRTAGDLVTYPLDR